MIVCSCFGTSERDVDATIRQGAARWFSGGIDTWTYQPVREAARVADELVRLLLQRRPNR